MAHMTLKEAVALLYKADELYYNVYNEWCSHRGYAPCGPPGICQYDTLAQVLEDLQTRHDQIITLRAEIKELKRTEDTHEADTILELCGNLGIKLEPSNIETLPGLSNL